MGSKGESLQKALDNHRRVVERTAIAIAVDGDTQLDGGRNFLTGKP